MNRSTNRTLLRMRLQHPLLCVALPLVTSAFALGLFHGPKSVLRAAELLSTQEHANTKIELATLVLPPVGRMKEITFNDLKLDLKKDRAYDASLLTKKVKQLKGQPVRIRGYMLPGAHQKGITQFVLMHKLSGGIGGEELDDSIVVEMTPPITVEYKTKPVIVEGFFSLRELKHEGRVLAIYHLVGLKVRIAE